MQECSKKSGNADPSPRMVAIDELTEGVLVDYARQFASRRILVDKDLPQLSADVYPLFIHAAVCQLIENAIDQMPAGGELNVTLVDNDRNWELEIADSPPDRQSFQRPALEHRFEPTLPIIAEPQQQSKLELARRAALVHGGQVQTWNCPQGGTANVLVIPRRQEIQKSA